MATQKETFSKGYRYCASDAKTEGTCFEYHAQEIDRLRYKSQNSVSHMDCGRVQKTLQGVVLTGSKRCHDSLQYEMYNSKTNIIIPFCSFSFFAQ